MIFEEESKEQRNFRGLNNKGLWFYTKDEKELHGSDWSQGYSVGKC